MSYLRKNSSTCLEVWEAKGGEAANSEALTTVAVTNHAIHLQIVEVIVLIVQLPQVWVVCIVALLHRQQTLQTHVNVPSLLQV